MTTLTDAVILSKKTIFRLGIAISVLIALFLIFKIGQLLLNAVSPPSPTPATVAFGKLPRLDLSEGKKPPDKIQYSIETISGELPNLASQTKVFAIVQAVPTFGILDKAKTKAESAGFNPQPFEVLNKSAKFADPKDKNRILTIETTSGNFTMESAFLINPQIVLSKPKSHETAKKQALNFFNNFGLSQKEYPQDKISFANYKVDDGKLVETPTLSSANLVRVILNRAELDKIPFVHINAQDPLVWALSTDQEIVAAKYISPNLQKHKFATYPLKGTSAAFDELKNGKGILNKEPENNVFEIRDMFLGYIETSRPQAFLQPVYIFMGDDDLIAAVPAINNAWIENKNQKAF